MISKVILIIVIVVLGLVVLLPFVLNVAGVQLLQVGSVGVSLGARTGTGLLRSTDSGKTWESVNFEGTKQGATSPPDFLSLIFHPTNPSILLAGSKARGLWQSANGGESWRQVSDKNSVLDLKEDVYKVFLGRSNPKIIYLAVYQNNRGRVLQSNDGGETFKEIYFTADSRSRVLDIFVNPLDTNYVMIITTRGGLLESQDAGGSWRVKKWFDEELVKLLANPNFPGEVYVVTAAGNIFKTFDGGENWADLTEGLREVLSNQLPASISQIFTTPLFSSPRRSLGEMVIAPSNPTILFLASGSELFRSTNGGFIWEKLKILIPPEAASISTIAVDPRKIDQILVGAGSQLYRSKDGGVNWSVSDLPTKRKIKSLFINPLNEAIFVLMER